MSRRPSSEDRIEANRRAQAWASSPIGGLSDDADSALVWEQIFPDLSEAPPTLTGPVPVGNWVPRGVGDSMEWVRNPGAGAIETGMWSDMARIPPKSKRPRILFLGESVARGFFFDPSYTPAKCLENLLADGAAGAPEIVDLSRNDIGLGALRDLAFAAASLKPDAYVVFAGNNWLVFNQTVRRNLQERAPRVLREGGVAWLREFLEKWLARQTERFLAQLAELGARTSTPVVYVLPEFNLGDFRVDSRPYPPRLTDTQAMATWRRMFARAHALLEAKDAAGALDCATRMIELDGGTTAASITLQARCYLSLGERESAHRALQRARDAEIWSPFATPRCFGVVQDTVRRTVPRLGIALVDTPAILSRRLQGEIPDRRVFHDYCHLNVEGIRSVVTAIAMTLQSCGIGNSISEEELLARFPSPEPSVSARASFLAAIHNATWGQSRAILGHHLRSARAADPSIVRYAACWAEAATRKIHPFYTRGFAYGLGLGDRLFLYRLATAGPFLFSELADEMAVVFGEPVAKHIRESLRRWHDVASRPVDLLETYYAATSWDDVQAKASGRTALYEAYAPVSRFILPNASGVGVRFMLRLRTRARDAIGATISVTTDGKAVAEISACGGYQSITFEVPPGSCLHGQHEIAIRWPDQPQAAGGFVFFACHGTIERFIASPIQAA